MGVQVSGAMLAGPSRRYSEVTTARGVSRSLGSLLTVPQLPGTAYP